MDGEIRVITQNDQMVTQALGGLGIADWGRWRVVSYLLFQ
jgi:hypothetical protein